MTAQEPFQTPSRLSGLPCLVEVAPVSDRREAHAADRRGPSGAIASGPVPAQEQIGVRCGERFSTYPELFGRALRATRGLSELGIGAGDRVALLLRNSIEFLEA